MVNEVEEIKNKIREAIENEPNKNDIKKVSLFGSYAYGEPKEGSDVDVLIEFKPEAVVGFFKFFDIRDNLEKYLKKKVDLLTPESISRFFRDDVLKKAHLVCDL